MVRISMLAGVALAASPDHAQGTSPVLATASWRGPRHGVAVRVQLDPLVDADSPARGPSAPGARPASRPGGGVAGYAAGSPVTPGKYRIGRSVNVAPRSTSTADPHSGVARRRLTTTHALRRPPRTRG